MCEDLTNIILWSLTRRYPCDSLRSHQPQRNNLSHVMKHLTNYSLNKRSGDYVHNEGVTSGEGAISGREEEDSPTVELAEEDPHSEVGSKRTLTSLLRTLKVVHPEFDEDTFFQKLVDISYATIKVMQPSLISSTRSMCPDDEKAERMLSGQCFQIFGLDILIDEIYRSWLLEVNGNPSMRLDHEVCDATASTSLVDRYVPSIVDSCVKLTVMSEALRIVASGHDASRGCYVDARESSSIAEEMECLDVIDNVTARYAEAFGGGGGEDGKNRLTLSLFRKILSGFREEKGGIVSRGKRSGPEVDLAYQRWDLDRRKKKGDDFDVWCGLWDFYDALCVIAKLVGIEGRNDYGRLSMMLS